MGQKSCRLTFSLLRQDALEQHHPVLSSAEAKWQAILERSRAWQEAEREAKREAWRKANEAFVGPRRQRGRPHGQRVELEDGTGKEVVAPASEAQIFKAEEQTGRWTGPGSKIARAKALAEHQARIERRRRKRERQAAQEVAKETKQH